MINTYIYIYILYVESSAISILEDQNKRTSRFERPSVFSASTLTVDFKLRVNGAGELPGLAGVKKERKIIRPNRSDLRFVSRRVASSTVADLILADADRRRTFACTDSA